MCVKLHNICVKPTQLFYTLEVYNYTPGIKFAHGVTHVAMIIIMIILTIL